MKLICDTCEKIFEKEDKEHKRQLKKGRNRFFCCRTCAAVKNNEEHPRKGNPLNLKADNRKDEHTPFRWYVLRAEYRDRKNNYGCDLTVEYLKQLWDQQNGICPFTGWSLVLPQDTNGWKEYSPLNASIDRIDNSIGYLQNNIRFVSVMANLARQTFTDEQLITFCKAVANKQLFLK